eukprot:1447987-Pleurochrysis_carterae.AAC.1
MGRTPAQDGSWPEKRNQADSIGVVRDGNSAATGRQLMISCGTTKMKLVTLTWLVWLACLAPVCAIDVRIHRSAWGREGRSSSPALSECMRRSLTRCELQKAT